jgi:hypothetical protein
MKHKTALSTVLTIVAVLGCLGMAAAKDPLLHDELTPSNTVSSEAIVVGLNHLHPDHCTAQVNGTTWSLSVVFMEGGTLITIDPVVMSVVGPACQTGNLLDITTDANLITTAVTAYPHK